MTEKSNIPAPTEKQMLPDCPEIALFLGLTAQRLACTFSISERMHHAISVPMCFRLLQNGRPQYLDAAPYERFRNDDEVNGAIKLITYHLSRLSESDADFVWTLLGAVHIDERKPFDFRELMA